MKLPLDQNLFYRLIERLAPVYPGSSQVRLLGLELADDLVIWKYARAHGYTIVTKDSDFHELSLLYGAPPKVIWLKCGNSSKVHVGNLLVSNHQEVCALLRDSSLYCLELH